MELVFTGAGMVEQTEGLLKRTAEGVDLRDKFFSQTLKHDVLLHLRVTTDGVLDTGLYSAICGGVPTGLENNHRLYYMRDFTRNFRPVIKVLKALFNLKTLRINSEFIPHLLTGPSPATPPNRFNPSSPPARLVSPPLLSEPPTPDDGIVVITPCAEGSCTDM
jgi:hypothetical protein